MRYHRHLEIRNNLIYMMLERRDICSSLCDHSRWMPRLRFTFSAKDAYAAWKTRLCCSFKGCCPPRMAFYSHFDLLCLHKDGLILISKCLALSRPFSPPPVWRQGEEKMEVFDETYENLIWHICPTLLAHTMPASTVARHTSHPLLNGWCHRMYLFATSPTPGLSILSSIWRMVL